MSDMEQFSKWTPFGCPICQTLLTFFLCPVKIYCCSRMQFMKKSQLQALALHCLELSMMWIPWLPHGLDLTLIFLTIDMLGDSWTWRFSVAEKGGSSHWWELQNSLSVQHDNQNNHFSSCHWYFLLFFFLKYCLSSKKPHRIKYISAS